MRSEFHEHETERIVRAASGGKAAIDGIVDTPHELDPTYSGTSADSGAWDRADPPTGTKGLELTITTREVYSTSTHELLAFTRVLTFDHRGGLKSVSAETSHVVDTLTQCPEEA